MNPLQSVREWVDGVDHREQTQLYAALTLEEAGELLQQIGHPSQTVRSEIMRGIGVLDGLGYTLRQVPGGYVESRKDLLDAALDTAWVSLCLAYTLTGDKLPQAWAELHRSNVLDKQQDGAFVKDATGKVKKPLRWTPPDFGRFV